MAFGFYCCFCRESLDFCFIFLWLVAFLVSSTSCRFEAHERTRATVYLRLGSARRAACILRFMQNHIYQTEKRRKMKEKSLCCARQTKMESQRAVSILLLFKQGAHRANNSSACWGAGEHNTRCVCEYLFKAWSTSWQSQQQQQQQQSR